MIQQALYAGRTAWGRARSLLQAFLRLGGQEERDRVACMVSAISASNEAILRAQTREALFDLVCQAAVQGGHFTFTAIILAEPGRKFLRCVGAAGPAAQAAVNVVRPLRVAAPEKRSLSSTAFHTGQPCISNDYLGTKELSGFHDRARSSNTRSYAALPLFDRGDTIGVFIFSSSQRDTFTPVFVELLQRLAGNISFALENFERADEKARAEARVSYLASHDLLTGLPNRGAFRESLRDSIDTAAGRKRAVLCIDLDRFKVINDSLGHEAGDALLIEFAGRLRGAVHSNHVVARFGGDEFVILLADVSPEVLVTEVAPDILALAGQPFDLCGQECRLSASIGIALFPDHGADEETLIKHADMAMSLAKAEGQNGIRLFSGQDKSPSADRLKMEAALRHALERDELQLHYQPKLNVATGLVAGVEALLRWRHPAFGAVPPATFIPIAEETGLIVPIGAWVIRTACAQNMAWQRAGLPWMSMAVNVSPRQFADPNLLSDIDDALATSGLDPQLLQIEITESLVMQNVERAISVLEAIHCRGVCIAMDDFGTGFSSMSTIKRFRIDTLKIDQSFVRDLPESFKDRAIAEAIIVMGKALGLKIVAEGVETAGQEAFLREHGCDEVQGYFYSKPVPADGIVSFLRKWRAGHPAAFATLSDA